MITITYLGRQKVIVEVAQNDSFCFLFTLSLHRMELTMVINTFF